jgi:hypothetical protein
MDTQQHGLHEEPFSLYLQGVRLHGSGMPSSATFGCAAATKVPTTTIRYLSFSELAGSYTLRARTYLLLQALYRVKALRWILAMLELDSEKSACTL